MGRRWWLGPVVLTALAVACAHGQQECPGSPPGIALWNCTRGLLDSSVCSANCSLPWGNPSVPPRLTCGNGSWVELDAPFCPADACALCNCSASEQLVTCNKKVLPRGALTFAQNVAELFLDQLPIPMPRMIPWPHPFRSIRISVAGLSSIHVEDINAEYGGSLERLALISNMLTEIRAGVFRNAPNLTHLDLSFNLIT
jgi:hypothetical protein